MKLTRALRQFLEYCEIEKGHSWLTIRNYQLYLTKFLDFASRQHAVQTKDITPQLVRKFRLFLYHHQPPLKKISQNYYLIALRSWLKYLQKQDLKVMSPEKIELAKTPQRAITILSQEELEKLLAAPLKQLNQTNNQKNQFRARRDHAILETLFSTGLRISELVNLNRETINFSAEGFPVRGKGDKIRLVFLSPNAKRALKTYLDLRTDEEKALFINRRAQRLSARSIQRMIQSYAKQNGITKKVTPHLLRHQFATDLLSAGADLRSVQTLLGHRSVTTTQIYTHITNRDLSDIHAAFHGKQRKK